MSQDTDPEFINVEIPLVGGLNLGAEDTVNMKPLQMVNCLYHKDNGVQKRCGTTKQNANAELVNSTNYSKAFQAETSYHDAYPVALGQLNGEPVLFTDFFVKNYSSDHQGWVRQDFYTPVSCTMETAAGQGTLGSVAVQTQASSPTFVVQGRVAQVFTDTVTTAAGATQYVIYARVLDADTMDPIVDRFELARALQSTYIGAGGNTVPYARVIAFGLSPLTKKFLFIYLKSDTTLGKIEYDCSTDTFGSATAVSGPTATVSTFEVDFNRAATTPASGDPAYILAWEQGNNTYAKCYDYAHNVLGTLTVAAVFTTALSLTFNGTRAYLAGGDSAGYRIYQIKSASGVLTSGDTYSGGASQIKATCITSATAASCRVVWQQDGDTYYNYFTSPGSGTLTKVYTDFSMFRCTPQSYLAYQYCGPNQIFAMAMENGGADDVLGTTESGCHSLVLLYDIALTNQSLSKFPALFPYATRTFQGSGGPCYISHGGDTPPPYLFAPLSRFEAAGSDTRVHSFAEQPPDTKTVQITRAKIIKSKFSGLTLGVAAAQSVQVQGEPHITYGGSRIFDGGQLYEQNFYNFPEVDAGLSQTTGSLTLLGTYGFAFCYMWVDDAGLVNRSAPSFESVTLTGSNQGVTGAVRTLQLSEAQWRSKRVRIECYRTVNGGTAFLFERAYDNDPSVATITVTLGGVVDTTLANNSELYINGGVLDNVCPPGGTCAATHGNRLWIGGTPDDSIWYSKEFVATEVPGFNEGLMVQPFEGGRVVAMISLDQNLIVFKQNGIYALSGSGPTDTGQQSSLSLPYKIQSDTGCVERRSVVSTPMGIFFQGRRGIYLLSRELQLSYIGKPIEDVLTVGAISDSILYARDSQVWFFTAPDTVYVYDYLNQAWGTYVFLKNDGTTMKPRVATIINGDVYMVNTDLDLYKYDTATGADSSYFVQMTYQTPWVKRQDLALGYQKIRRMAFRGRRQTDVDPTITLYFNYDTTVTEGRTFASDTGSWTSSTLPRELQVIPGLQKCEAISIMYTDAIPTGSGHSTGTGKGFVLSSLSLQLQKKQGLNRIRTAQVK